MSKTATAPAAKHRRQPAAARVLGSKGGESKPYTPYKAPDSALSVATVKLLYALSEGPIVGPVDGLRSIKLNGTPLISPDGSENFPGTIWDFRSGTVDQEHIAGFPAIENEASQGLPVELKSDNAWTHAITDQQLSAVRIRLSWPQIWQVKTNGDQIGYRIDYAIDLSVDGGSYQTVLSATLNDKGTTEYERTHRIDLPEGFTSAFVRVRRLTPNRNDSNFADLMRIKGLTEVIDKKLRYPNLALGGLRFDAKQFQDTPKFAGLMRGRIVQVPTNYDPHTRTYTGDWNGTFKLAYTNNPVWIWRDLLLHRRYGLGRRITADMVDHWTLYEIGRYCDVMVPDGKGGLQPRMTTNVYIQDSIEGYALLSDLASVFRGSSCWNGSQVTMVADIPGNEDGYVFTRSNIIGEFEYVSAAFPDRHTRAKVAWDNPENEFKTQPAPVTNDELIGVLGHRMLDISRFACTVEGEAIRHGIWALKSEQYEEWSVSFTTGMEGRNVEPGQIICVADELFSGRANGGRISAATKRVITLDIDAEVHEEDRLILNLPSGKSEGRIVKSVSGRLVTVMADYSELPEAECSWSVESADLAVMRFRVQTIEPQGLHQFKIAATQHEPMKYQAIDTGARIDPQPTSVIPPGVMSPPENITLESRSVVSQGIAITGMRITWDSVPGAIAYNVEWRKDSGNWVRLPRTGNLGADVEGIYSGRYVARVSSVNAMDVTSIWGTSQEVALTGKVGKPPALAFISATGITMGMVLKWGFPAGAEDTAFTEIEYGTSNTAGSMLKLGDFSYPTDTYTMMNLKSGVRLFFRGRIRDRTGNIGPWGDIVSGLTVDNGDVLLDYVKGQIDESSLVPALNGRIDLVDGDGPGSVNDRIKGTRQELETLITQYIDALEWKATHAYAVGDIVRKGNKLYQALAASTNSEPPSEKWKDVGDILQTANGLAVRVNNLEQSVTEQDGRISSNQKAISRILTRVDDPKTGLQASADAITQVKQDVTAVDGRVTAQSERIDGVYAEIKGPMAGSESDLAGSTQGYAGVWSIQSAITDGDYAQAKLTQSLEAQVNKNYATYEQTTTALVNGQAAQTTQTTALRSEFEGNKSTVQTQIKTVSDQASATAQQTTQLQTAVNGHSQQFQQQATINQTVDGKITGTYSFRFKFDVNGQPYSTGVGLGLETGPNGEVTSRFVIQADQFAIYNGQPGAAGSSVPFAVNGTETYLKAAFIQKASITMLMIGDNLQSSNWVDQTSGWKLPSSGAWQFNGTDGRMKIVNTGIFLYHPNGVAGIELSL